MVRLADLKFVDLFTSALPRNPATTQLQHRTPRCCYSLAKPVPFEKVPSLVCFSDDTAALLELDKTERDTEEFCTVFSGSRVLEGKTPWAERYGGFQFGVWAGQLGDGRAVSLGQIQTSSNDLLQIALKGSGKTPYSRSFDGRATLRESLREFLCSEALHYLGVPTVRSLCVFASDETIYRNGKYEPAGVLCRVSPTFLRFGSFEILHAHNEHDIVKTLCDYAIKHHFAHIDEKFPADESKESNERYEALFGEIVEKTAILLAHWHALGFCHGVLNTDNFSILGMGMDYGPYAFLQRYEPQFVCNPDDQAEMYAFSKQATQAFANLYRLSLALAKLVSRSAAKTSLKAFEPAMKLKWSQLMKKKLGLQSSLDDDFTLFTELVSMLEAGAVDYHSFFRLLGEHFDARSDSARSKVLSAFFAGEPKAQKPWDAWSQRYKERLAQECDQTPEEQQRRRDSMGRANPRYVLRSQFIDKALELAIDQKDYSLVECLYRAVRRPFETHPEFHRLFADCEKDLDFQNLIQCSC